MKKVLTIFLCGQLLIFTYIFHSSIYEVYGLLHIGDTTLSCYYVNHANREQLSMLYDVLNEKQLPIQIINTPISEDKIIYEIHHTQVEELNQFVGLGKTNYHYYKLTKEDFVDGSGYFYSSLSSDIQKEINENYNIEVLYDDLQHNFTSYSTVFYNNLLNLVLLMIVTIIVMSSYSLNKNKENAIQFLHGYSPSQIVISRIRDVFIIEAVIFVGIVLITNIYFAIENKWSRLYCLLLICFLTLVIIFNIFLLYVIQKIFEDMDVCNILKNNLYTNRMNTIMCVLKIIFLVILTISSNQSYHYHKVLKEYKYTLSQYKVLTELYSSYGYNASEAQKIRNNHQVIAVSQRVKDMYLSKYDTAYVMDESVTSLSLAGSGFNITPQELHNSYLYNYAILNLTFLEDYTQIETSGLDAEDCSILLVPEKYKESELLVYEHYFSVINNMINYNRNYNFDLPERKSNIQIKYIDNGITYKLPSSYRYEEYTDIELTDAIIIVDQGQFDSAYYFHLLSDEKLAFKVQSKSEFQALLIDYQLDKLFHSHTLVEPFLIRMSNNKFLLNQSILYIVIFCITTIFIFYISNYINIMTNKNRFAIKLLHGFSRKKILTKEIMTVCILMVIGAVLTVFHIHVLFYFTFLIIDLLMCLFLYKNTIVKRLANILNGGY